MFTMLGSPHYLHWGWIQISTANLIVVGAMVLLFILAVLLRMPGETKGRDHDHRR